ncbi:MAG: HAMP domain-containing protein, partial [Phycisphaerae bacterium]|nr:HAMP domain-containing protein [Phycisphaerae bacterium]
MVTDKRGNGEKKQVGRTGLGLQIKSVLVLTCVIVAVVAAGGWYYYRAVREMVWRNNYVHAEQLGKALSFAAETDLRDKRWDCLDDLTRDMVRFEKNSVPYVAIVDAEGHVVSSAARSGQTEQWQRLFRAGPSKLNLSRHDGRYVLITRPIISRDKVWLKERLAGGVRMVLDISDTKRALVQAKQKILYAAVWIALFAIPLGYVLINRVLVYPIRRLVHVTRRLAGGDLQARSGLNRRDEVGVLAVAMDDMA